MPSRRRYLAATGTVTLASLSGCSSVVGRPSPSEPPAPATPALEPERHIYGADGEWSSFGCNAANTRSVHGIDAGEAPVDGVSEDWRVPVNGVDRDAPVVANGRVFLSSGDGLRVLDAADGAESWRADGVEDVPVVRDGTAYVADRDGRAIRALAVDDGAERWTVPVDAPPVGATQYPGRPVIAGAGETVLALDPETGEEVWSRRVFGAVLPHPPVWNGYAVAVTTQAGEVALLRLSDGSGVWRYGLPSPPTCPPSADTDSVYITCRNGNTYALGEEDPSGREPRWSVDTGWSAAGLGVDSGMVFAGTTGDLHAIDAGTGEVRWRHAIGDWRHTAPAVGRDTLFVGGDRLWALDPTEGGGNAGPPVRFERSFHGRVGPGPVLDNGTLYVVAETASEETHLLALS